MIEIRLLQNDCNKLHELNTTYNSNEEVLPYVGIMFQFRTKNEPIDVRTLELDIRFKDLTDHSIEVYTFKGSFSFIVNKPLAWELLASTEIVPNPSGVGAIIPVNDFKTVSMEAEELRSFYVTMKGPWLDYTVNAMQKAGELALSNDHLDVYTGAGLTAYKFPEQIDTTVSPKFAGVIHYDTKVDCQPGWKITSIGYQFIIDRSMSPDIASKILAGIEYVLDDQLENDKVLSRYRKMYALRKKEAARGDPAEYNVDCPPGWNACPSLLGSIAFEHADTLEAGDLLYQLYKFASHITDAIGKSMSPNRIAYVGFDDAAAELRFTVNGVPAGEEMDIVQQIYFSNSLRDYFNSVVPSWNTKILAVHLDEQILEETRRGLRDDRRLPSNGSINLIGRINGAQLAYLTEDEYAAHLQTALDESQYKLVSDLNFGILRPGDVADEAKANFFRGIESVYGQIKAIYPTLPPTIAPSALGSDIKGGGGDGDGGGKGNDLVGDINVADAASGVDSFIWIAVGAAVGGLALLVISCLIFRRWMRNAQDNKTRKARRGKKYIPHTGTFEPSDHTPPTDSNRKRTTVEASPSSDPEAEDSQTDRECKTPALAAFMEKQPKPIIDPRSGSRSVQPSRMVDRSAMTKHVKEFEDLESTLQISESAPERRRMPPRTATKSFDDAEPKRATPDRHRTHSFSEGVRPEQAPSRPENLNNPSQDVDEGQRTPSLTNFMDQQPKPKIDPLSGSRSFHPSRSVDRSGMLKPVKEAEDIHGSSKRVPPQRTRSDDGAGHPPKRPPPRTRSDDGTGYVPGRPPRRSGSGDSSHSAHRRMGDSSPGGRQSNDNASLSSFMDQEPKPNIDPLSGARSFHPSRSIDRSGMLKPVKEAEDIHPSLPRRPSLQQPKPKVDPLSGSRSFHPSRSVDRSGKLKPVKEAEDIRGSTRRVPPQRTRSDDGTRQPPRRPPQRTSSDDGAGYSPRRPPKRSGSGDSSHSDHRRPPRRSCSDDGTGRNPRKPPQRSHSDDGGKSTHSRRPPHRTRSDDGTGHDPRRQPSSLSSFMGKQRKDADPLSGPRSVQSMHHRRPQTQQAKLKPVKEYEDIQRKAPSASRSFDNSTSLYSAGGKDRPKRRPPRPSRSDDGLDGYDGRVDI